MATIPNEQIQVFGKGTLQAEGVVIDKEGNAWGGGRNGKVYKVSPDGKVHEVCQLPEGSIPNGVALDRAGNFVYCDLGKQAVMKCAPDGKVSMIADRVGDVKLTLPNFCSYDAEGNLYISNSSTEDISKVLGEITAPSPKGALVRVRPNGKGDVIATGIYLANGTAIDPKTLSMSWKARAMMSCVSSSIRTARLANRKFIRRIFLRCQTGWRSMSIATSTSRSRPLLPRTA